MMRRVEAKPLRIRASRGVVGLDLRACYKTGQRPFFGSGPIGRGQPHRERGGR